MSGNRQAGYGSSARTREDKARALCTRLILARDHRIDELVSGHTAETFAEEHAVPVGMIRETFEQTLQRRFPHG